MTNDKTYLSDSVCKNYLQWQEYETDTESAVKMRDCRSSVVESQLFIDLSLPTFLFAFFDVPASISKLR